MNAAGRSTGGLLARARANPVALAIALSVVAAPIVALPLLVRPWYAENVGWRSMGLPAAVLVMLLTLLPTGLVGGALGGRFLAKQPVLAVFLSLAIAWPLAISLLPVSAAALGVTLRAGDCFNVAGTCRVPSLTDEAPLSGVLAYALSVIAGGIFVIPPIVGLVLLAAARILGRRGHVGRGIILVIAGYVALHWVSIKLEGLVAFTCLAVGVVVWWYLAGRRQRVAAVGPAAIEGGAVSGT